MNAVTLMVIHLLVAGGGYVLSYLIHGGKGAVPATVPVAPDETPGGVLPIGGGKLLARILQGKLHDLLDRAAHDLLDGLAARVVQPVPAAPK